MMRHILCCLIALLSLITPCPAHDEPVRVGLFDELVELYPDANPRPGSAQIDLHTPRGVPVGVHLLVRPDDARTIEFALTRAGQPVAGTRWYRLIDVPVEENTGLASRTERFDGRPNPYVIRKAPFRVFEVLKPVTSPIEADAPLLALRVELDIPPDARTGRREYDLLVGAPGQQVTLRLAIHVHGAIVPPVGPDTFAYTNWFSTSNIASWHDLEPWSEEFWVMLGRYARLMARGRQNTFWVRWPDMFERDADGKPMLNRKRLERYVRTFDDAGLYYIEGAPITHRPGRDWSTTHLELSIVNVPATSEEGRRAFAAMADQIMSAINDNGWQGGDEGGGGRGGRWIQHLSDEPTDTNAEDYKRFAAIVRGRMPGVPIIEATMSRQVAGAVDIWCPQVHKYQQQRDFFLQRQELGERVWTYTCLVPGGPWINRLLDQERLRQVYIGWAASRFNTDGFLHWGLNQYMADPFTQSVVDHPAQPNTKNKLPAGDTHVIYPGDDGPWSGQRFEALRIGLEDHELLEQLRARDPALAKSIITSVFRAYDDYDIDVAKYRDARRRLLEALDE